MDCPVVEIKGVSKQFGAINALDDISLKINRNKVFGLLGPNGAGKSTLLDLLIGFRAPTEGAIRVLQTDPQDNPRAVRRCVGIIPDAVSVIPNWTGREHINYVTNSMAIEETPETALERVDLQEAIDRCAGKYSRGMQQRLVLAMALVGEPELLLLDEPLTGVDPEGTKIILDVISQEQKKGTSIVFSSHRLKEVATVADRVCMLADGTIVETVDSPEEMSQSIIRVSVDTPPSSLKRITEISGVSNAKVHQNAVEVTCTDQAKKRVQDTIEEICGPIRNVTIEEGSLEDKFLEAIR